MSDLKQGIIRAIGDDPEHRFLKDPVRMMRCVRHAARTGFIIETNTWKSLLKHKDKIHLCAISRVRDEWLKDLRSGYSKPWAELMIESDLLGTVFSSYASVLENNKHKDLVRRLLLGLLEQLDRIVKNDIEVSEAFILALFAYPRLRVTPKWKTLEVKYLKWPIQEVRSLLDKVLFPYDFRRSVKDKAAQILSSQWNISICLSRGNWPKRVWSKATFRESIMLYDLVQKVLGQPVIGLDSRLLLGSQSLNTFHITKRCFQRIRHLTPESKEI
jgi:poly(A) polymerase